MKATAARNAVRFDFHPKVLADPLGLAAAYFLAGRRKYETFVRGVGHCEEGMQVLSTL